LSDSKPFQKYYRKAKEARKVHLDEKFFADSMEALRPVAQVLGFLSLLLDPAKKAIVVLPMQDSASAEVSVKGFLRRGFLNPSPVVQANLSHKVSVVSASTLGFPTAIKGEDFRVNDLTQSQKWPVSFSPSREVVAWEKGDEIWDGEDGDSHYPLVVLPPDLALDWEFDSDEDMDPSLVMLEAIEEDFNRGVKAVRPKTKGMREVLNLVSSINYSDSSASSQLRKGKAHVV